MKIFKDYQYYMFSNNVMAITGCQGRLPFVKQCRSERRDKLSVGNMIKEFEGEDSIWGVANEQNFINFLIGDIWENIFTLPLR